MNAVLRCGSGGAVRSLVAALTVLATTAATAGDRDAVAVVPPVSELEILDPRVDSEGKPRAVVLPGPTGVAVDVPPTVIVHHYYYTGDRDFRAPLLPGGPTVLVVNHPVTGERTYVEVQMLPGVPRIEYRRHSITYDYGRRRMRVDFPPCGRPTVRFCESDGLAETAREHGVDRARHAESWIHRTGIPHAVGTIARSTADAVDASADRIRDAGRFAAAPVNRVWRTLPVSGMLSPDPAAQARRARDTAVGAADGAEGFLGETIPTVR